MVARGFVAPDGGLVFDAWLTAAVSRHVDPYTVWTLQTNFRQFGRAGREPEFLDFLIELDHPMSAETQQWLMGLTAGPTEIPDIYLLPMPGSSRIAKHITVRLPTKGGNLGVVALAVADLVFLDGVRRIQIGFPRPKLAVAPSVLPKPPAGKQSGSGAAGPPVKVLLGVLEDGCPFGHPSLISGRNQTRVVALWDQTLVAVNTEDPSPEDLDYGRERRQVHLNSLLRRHSDGHGIDEEALYEDPASLQRRLPSRGSHAAAVITLMAGRQALLPSHSTATCISADRPGLQTAQASGNDAASELPLAVVQFPREQINLAGARWMVVRALDGLRYLAAVSAEMAQGEQQAPLPLVVNLSYGSMVGAHDGTALLETAMAELAQAHGRMAIVLAAGNSHGTGRDSEDADGLARLPSGRHAVHELPGPRGRALLRLYVPPNKPIETYLEIWFEDLDKEARDEQFLRRDDVQIRAVSPHGQILEVKQFPGIAFDSAAPEDTRAGLLCFPRVAQSQRRSMALLVVVATQMSTTRVEGPSGIWTVEVSNRSQRQLRVQAWVERDVVAGAARRSQAARLLDGDDPDAASLSDDNTLNNIATGAEVFRVGALSVSGPEGRTGVSPYSSAAAADQPGPEFSAVADELRPMAGIRVSGNCGGTVVRMNGTSVAAPQAARWLANRMAAGATLAQIRDELVQSPQGDQRRGRIEV